MPEIDEFQNPWFGRYASREMIAIFSERRKYATWRLLWIVLAETQRELGLPITAEQIAELRAHQDDIDFAKVRQYEQQFRHDVMAHLHAFGDTAPLARSILHLGATSAYVTDNTDLVLMREALDLLLARLLTVMRHLVAFARRHRDVATLGFTHFQPAQLTTVGKRACLWLYDLVLDLENLDRARAALKLRGAKGATGTQASFLALFDGDHEKVRRLDQLVALKLGFDQVYPVTGQTYSRKVDSGVLEVLAGIGQSAHKFATDVRLLMHRRELEEPFEEGQVGSSAMPYKRNPMRCERMCGLARFVMSLPANSMQTASNQWLERTLDDSANRRLVLPQAFLGADAIVRLYANVVWGMTVNLAVVGRAVEQELPFMATESILMAATRAGGDRQALHEILRRHSRAVAERMKRDGGGNDLIDRLKREPDFANVDWHSVLDPGDYVGRAPQQVDEFLAEVLQPILDRYHHIESTSAQIDV
jgi:adenylosuccinate lyase